MDNLREMILKLRIGLTVIAGLALMLSLESCEKEGSNESKTSTYGSTESHNTGQNCMNCHQEGEGGEGWFTVAGTVYDSTKTNPFKNATITLVANRNGTAFQYTIEGDANGNFYTTDPIDFSEGLFTSVQGAGIVHEMSSKIFNGQCNSCHGSSTDRIWTE